MDNSVRIDITKQYDSFVSFNAFTSLCSECANKAYFHVVFWTAEEFKLHTQTSLYGIETVTKIETKFTLRGKRICGICGASVHLAGPVIATDSKDILYWRELARKYTDTRALHYEAFNTVPFGLVLKSAPLQTKDCPLCGRCGHHTTRQLITNVLLDKSEDADKGDTTSGMFVDGHACMACGYIGNYGFVKHTLPAAAPYAAIRAITEVPTGPPRACKVVTAQDTVSFHLMEFAKQAKIDVSPRVAPHKAIQLFNNSATDLDGDDWLKQLPFDFGVEGEVTGEVPDTAIPIARIPATTAPVVPPTTPAYRGSPQILVQILQKRS